MRIDVEHLACRRSERLVFSGLSFSVSPGQMVSITGRNGAGKSSLLAILAGRLAPASGLVRVDGTGGAPLSERLHLVGHRDALKASLTAEENLRFAQELLGGGARSPREALAVVGLEPAARLPVGYLSAGQRRRVALARLLVAYRPLWLLDEPTSALDAASQAILARMMAAHCAEGGLILAATHLPLGHEGGREIRLEGPTASLAQEEGGGLADRPEPTFLGLSPRVITAAERGSPSSPAEAAEAEAALMADEGGWARPALAVFVRDLKLAARVGGSGALGLVFFLMIVTIVPFALGPDLNLLSRIGAAILWLAAVLSTLLGLDRLFQADEEDGSLDLFATAPAPLELLVLAKMSAHWLGTGLPLALAAPLFGLLVALTPPSMAAVSATLIVGTPALTAIGAIGAALTASIRRGGLILAILVLPLMIPTLIFGVSAADAATDGTVPFATPFLVLAALSLGSAVVAAVGAAAALRSGE